MITVLPSYICNKGFTFFHFWWEGIESGKTLYHMWYEYDHVNSNKLMLPSTFSCILLWPKFSILVLLCNCKSLLAFNGENNKRILFLSKLSKQEGETPL